MKTNQLKTDTTRQPSILNPHKGFILIIWQKVINNLSGLSYTEKKFLQFVISVLTENYTIAGNSRRHWQSSIDIVKEIYGILQAIIHTASIPNYRPPQNHRYLSEKYFHARPNGSGHPELNIQKIIRHYMHVILTEREIRKYGNYWTKKYPDKQYRIENIQPFVSWVIKKTSKFGYTLAEKIYKHGSQIVHIAEPKSYFGTRPINWERFTLNDIIIAYDSYMDRHIKFANLDFSSNIATKLISNSLLNDIIDSLKTTSVNTPKKIKANKERFKESQVQSILMQGYAEAMRLLPASQQEDRHFTINSRGDMSYTPAKKSTFLNQDKNKWLSGQDRMVAKYGKGVKKLFQQYPYPIPDHITEHICNELKSKHQFTGEIKIVSGDEIKQWYLHTSYSRLKNTASLANSCMKHTDCQQYINFYAYNEDVCKMIIITEKEGEDKKEVLMSRALLWTTDCNTQVVDRIYGTDKYINIMKQYASDKGYMVKARQSYEDATTFVTPIGEVITQEYKITTKYKPHSRLPYMDTFFYSHLIAYTDGREPKHVLCNNSTYSPETLRCTSGSYTRAMREYNETVPRPESNRDDYVTIDGREYHIDDDDIAMCDYYQEYYHQDDLCWSETDGCMYHSDIVYWVGDYVFCTEREYNCHMWSEAENEYIWADDAYSVYDLHGRHVDYILDNTVGFAWCVRNDYYMREEDTFICEITQEGLSTEFVQEVTTQNGVLLVSDELDEETINEYLEENNYERI